MGDLINADQRAHPTDYRHQLNTGRNWTHGTMSPHKSKPWRVNHPHPPSPDHTCPRSRSEPPHLYPNPREIPPTAETQLTQQRQPDDQDHRSVANTSPMAATDSSRNPYSYPPPPHHTPPLLVRPTTNTNEIKAKHLGPGSAHPCPPPPCDSAHHNPQQNPLRPAAA